MEVERKICVKKNIVEINSDNNIEKKEIGRC